MQQARRRRCHLRQSPRKAGLLLSCLRHVQVKTPGNTRVLRSCSFLVYVVGEQAGTSSASHAGASPCVTRITSHKVVRATPDLSVFRFSSGVTNTWEPPIIGVSDDRASSLCRYGPAGSRGGCWSEARGQASRGQTQGEWASCLRQSCPLPWGCLCFLLYASASRVGPPIRSRPAAGLTQRLEVQMFTSAGSAFTVTLKTVAACP